MDGIIAFKEGHVMGCWVLKLRSNFPVNTVEVVKILLLIIYFQDPKVDKLIGIML